MAWQNRLERLSDAEVVGVAQLGSLEAYDELVRRFRGAVLMVARQFLNTRQAAEDVAQEAFVQAFQGLPRLNDPAKFPGWLYAITRHRAQRVGQREVRNQATEDSVLEHLLTEQQGAYAPDPLDTLLETETQTAIQTLLSDLTPDVRIVMHLYYYEQMPTARIATFLALPVTTVKWRLHTGRRQLSRPIDALLNSAFLNDALQKDALQNDPLQNDVSLNDAPQNDVSLNDEMLNSALPDKALLEKKEDERSTERTEERTEERDSTPAQPDVQNSGTCRTRGADRQLRERSAQLRGTLQCGCGTP